MKAWLKTVARRAICDTFRKGKRDEIWLKCDQGFDEPPSELLDLPKDPSLVHPWLKDAIDCDEHDTEALETPMVRPQVNRNPSRRNGATPEAWRSEAQVIPSINAIGSGHPR